MRKFYDIYYSEEQTNDKALNLYLPDTDSFPLFIYFHGGGIVEGDKNHVEGFMDYLLEHNIAVASINYRMYPNAKWPDFLYDVAEGTAWVLKNIHNYGNCEKVVVGGSSAGGYFTQMLCFNKEYLNKYGVNVSDIDAFIHDAGQPTTHFNVLKERGIDTRRVIVDEAAPLYYIGLEENYPSMLFLVSTEDLENRYEQTMLMMSTLKHFEYDMSKIELKVLESKHCEYIGKKDTDGINIFAKIIEEYVNKK